MTVLRAYLDCSGKPSNRHGYLTLAAVAASDGIWVEFEKQWWEILGKHKPAAKYVHMREILRLIDEFDPKHGWDAKSAFDVAMQCASYMSHLDKKRFRLFYCAVDLAAWRKLTEETYQIPDPVDLCNRFCSESVLGWYLHHYPDLLDLQSDSIRYFFDRDEPFLEPFLEKWKSETKGPGRASTENVWALIGQVSPETMKTTPGIQAADIIAWGVNREKTSKEGEAGYYLAEIIREVVPSFHIVWDEARMKPEFRPLIYRPW